ncbi:Gfo/Idh/MocA family protein [Marinihelvus fidelis]|nr:Gfo/Idh/MocA family oxidoreductase [Marinihelvus fidelis]
MQRRQFLTAISMLAAGQALSMSSWGFAQGDRKLRVTLVGTGIRGTSFWGKRLVEQYGDILEFTGLCDNNPGRLAYAKEYMGVDCPVYEDFEAMVEQAQPDLVIVCTKDSTHHEFIVKGLDMGCDVLTEKPMTTDEDMCQQILDAERRSGRNLIVGFNYRWSPYATKIKELISEGAIGDVVSVDFNWYLNTYHGASYFRRWHGLRDSGGTLLVHKSTHHFDLLNWWLDSDPQQVFGYGALEHYGANGPFRGDNCRNCEHTAECKYYWDITDNERLVKLYADNEQYDGYIRDNCLFREEIDIFDKMSVQVKYASNAVVNYSLTTYSPFEGWRIAFNGSKGRIEAWHDIPYRSEQDVSQADLHAAEMRQDGEAELEYAPLIVHRLWEEHETVVVPMERSGHGGGDKRLHDKIFANPEAPDPYRRAAGSRDGAMSVLIGVAARKSIDSGQPIDIASLTDLSPQARRPA